MSPEQASGQSRIDGRADIYALGCTLYEMLAGDPPFLASTPRAVLARQSLDPVPRIHTVRQSVPSSVEQAITKALAKVPADSLDRKSTRLNSSHSQISYAVFCLRKKKLMLIVTMIPCTSANCHATRVPTTSRCW